MSAPERGRSAQGAVAGPNEEHLPVQVMKGNGAELTRVSTLRPVVAAHDNPRRSDGFEPLHQHASGTVRVVCHDQGARRQVGRETRPDENGVALLQGRQHAATANPEPPGTPPAGTGDGGREVRGGSGCARHQPPASSHFTSRFFVAQKMSWIFWQAATSAFASSMLTPTLHAEQSLAAFQKVS